MKLWIDRENAASLQIKTRGQKIAEKYISKYLHQAVIVPMQKKKLIILTGAEVLTSKEAMKIMQKKEDGKQKQDLKKRNKRKRGREKGRKNGSH